LSEKHISPQLRGKSIVELLDILRNKGHCTYTRRKASQSLHALSKRIEERDYMMLSIAFSHMYECNEGSNELIEICKELMEKYK